MWSRPTPDRYRPPEHYQSWHYTPQPCNSRRVLIIIDLDQLKSLMAERHSDVMEMTSHPGLPTIGRLEENALFTYSFLVTPTQIQSLTVETILYYISQHINNTWGVHLEPHSMDLRWSDCTGDSIALRNHQIVLDLLREHHPHWTDGQEIGLLNAVRDFEHRRQPYIMRMSCHKALANPNMLP